MKAKPLPKPKQRRRKVAWPPSPLPSAEELKRLSIEANRKCPYCRSRNVVIVDADNDYCEDCKKSFSCG